ncbi:ABC transporter substrate-binding protein [Botrimarina sp.]|uniref:ABC transporter substrate-binding protein n=1 Tax=Botrimarina sp. TaxID=2795802 RepID=UPI0032ED9011
MLTIATIGCGRPSADETGSGAASDGADTTTTSGIPFELGDLMAPFDAPATLEELDGGVEWVESPVVDTMALLRKEKEDEPQLVSVEEALSMRNNSDEDNEAILSALSVLAPADGEGVDYGAELNRSIPMDLNKVNVLQQSSMSEQDIAGLVGFGLFTFDWNMTPYASADTVRSWQTSSDRMVDKVVMRDDLTWSDGEPITAHDVEFSYKLIMTEAVPIPAVRSGMESIAAVKAYDDHTVVYFHKESLATNVWNLNFPIVPKHVYEDSAPEDPTLVQSDYHAQLEREPIVGGPYEFERRDRGQQVLLRRRESWYTHKGERVRDKPYFARVRHRVLEDANTRLNALKSAAIDEAELGAEQWITQTDGEDFYRHNTKVRGSQHVFFYIGWNLQSPLFKDLRVRRALALALNYREMLDDLCFGLYPQCHGPFHPESWAFSDDPPELYSQDLDAAEDLLDEAGWGDSDYDGVRDKEIGGRVVPLEFSLMVSSKPDRIAICNLFRENLESIGIRCNVQPLEAAVMQQRMFDKSFEAAFSGWGAGADPYTTKNIFATGENRNYGSYSNPEVDRLFEEAEREFDRGKRAELYGKIHNLIFEDQPYLFLYTYSAFYGFNKELRGYRFSPRGPFSYSPGLGSVWVPAAN